ncbi:MAG: NAD(P)H-binding protein [Clostridia bacterium]|nr:NAD(P)H-binding protein [Clostridia bacterium]
MKKILVIGGTGAMGVYLVPELLSLGYKVDVVASDLPVSDNPNLTYTKLNAKDFGTMSELVKKGYDAIIDFMVYPTSAEYEVFLPMYLKNTNHYFYLSSYRVYADEEHPVKETSPRLLDVSRDEILLSSGDYCIYKAQGEDYLKASSFNNWTILRPAITYSKRRFQLVTLEMDTVVKRMLEGKTLLLPEEAMNVQATMSWGGDVGRMIARLVLNPVAYREAYSVCTSEHHTWGEIAEIYKKIGNLNCKWVDKDTFLDIISWHPLYSKQQLVYDRLFDRIMDNSKILNATGMKQSELIPLEKGLELELSQLPKNISLPDNTVNIKMDKYLEEHK